MPANVFPLEVMAAAQASQRKYGCPAPVTCAQWALESAYGKHVSGKNNPFGIKARPGEPSTAVNTHEVINGERVAVVARFRDFTSLEDAFDQHGKLLATGKAYAEAREVKNDPRAYARALTGHYATDPLYDRKLISIMDAHNLYALGDLPLTPVVAIAATPAPQPAKSQPTGILAALRGLFFRKAA